MAESISEGTLKTWQKKVGDTVEADEEVATIETDKVCVPHRYSLDDVFSVSLSAFRISSLSLSAFLFRRSVPWSQLRS